MWTPLMRPARTPPFTKGKLPQILTPGLCTSNSPGAINIIKESLFDIFYVVCSCVLGCVEESVGEDSGIIMYSYSTITIFLVTSTFYVNFSLRRMLRQEEHIIITSTLSNSKSGVFSGIECLFRIYKLSF